MPSFSDSIFLFILALLLFGPKRLPALARELGKWVGEFRRASNEFKMQMDEELRLSEQADRNKQIAAMEAAAPVTPALPAETNTETAATEPNTAMAAYLDTEASRSIAPEVYHPEPETKDPLPAVAATEIPATPPYEMVDGVRQPIPIATSGELNIMPPATGLPAARSSALKGLIDSIPPTNDPNEAANTTETAAHGN